MIVSNLLSAPPILRPNVKWSMTLVRLRYSSVKTFLDSRIPRERLCMYIDSAKPQQPVQTRMPASGSVESKSWLRSRTRFLMTWMTCAKIWTLKWIDCTMTWWTKLIHAWTPWRNRLRESTIWSSSRWRLMQWRKCRASWMESSNLSLEHHLNSTDISNQQSLF